MTKIAAITMLLENQRLKEQVEELKTTVNTTNRMLDELDTELTRLEELCHANGISI